jgi:hypothetical protein
MRRYLARLLNQVQSLDLWPLGVRRALLRGMGAEVTGDAMVQAGVDVVAGRCGWAPVLRQSRLPVGGDRRHHDRRPGPSRLWGQAAHLDA